MLDLGAVKDWIGEHKWESGGIGAATIGGGVLIARHRAKAAGNTGKPARLVVGRSNAQRVMIALREIETHHHRQPERKQK